MTPLIVVTYAAAGRKRDLIRSLLDGFGTVVFLQDLPPEERARILGEAEVLLTWNPLREVGAEGLRLIGKVRMIQLLSAGADHLPFGELPPGIVLASNVGAYAEPMAEHVLAMTLALAKDLLPAHRDLSNGRFDQSVRGRMFRGAVCGILGFGGIGRATARLMRGLGLRIFAVNTSGKTDEAAEFAGTLRDLAHVLSSSDVVVISLPLTRATRGLIGGRELALMKEDAILINVARGAIVDEGALYEHLLSHPRFRAGIDSWWTEPFGDGAFRTNYPFFSLPNLLGSPHNSAIVPGGDIEATRRAVENIQRFLSGLPITGTVRREDYLLPELLVTVK